MKRGSPKWFRKEMAQRLALCKLDSDDCYMRLLDRLEKNTYLDGEARIHLINCVERGLIGLLKYKDEACVYLFLESMARVYYKTVWEMDEVKMQSLKMRLYPN